MGPVTANSVTKKPRTSISDPSMTLRGCIYHYIGTILPLPNTQPFLSFYIQYTYFTLQTQTRMTAMSQIQKDLLQQLMTVVHDISLKLYTLVYIKDMI